MMAWSATMIGALLGLGTQMYSNALRKLPYMRHPWEHMLGMGLGVVFATQLVKWDAQLEEDLDKMLDKAKDADKRRYFYPWEHVLGIVTATQLVKWDAQLEKDLNMAKAANERRYFDINFSLLFAILHFFLFKNH